MDRVIKGTELTPALGSVYKQVLGYHPFPEIWTMPNVRDLTPLERAFPSDVNEKDLIAFCRSVALHVQERCKRAVEFAEGSMPRREKSLGTAESFPWKGLSFGSSEESR
jgi:hypothetical protein